MRPVISLICLPLLAQEVTAPARFHHVHLNSTDPAAAVRFYTSRLESERRVFADGQEAIWAHGSWILIAKTDAPPRREITSALWHIGWGGGENMRETYQKQIELGTRFATPLTDLSDQCDGKGGNGRFLFAYIDGPDGVLTELNTTPPGQLHFGHVHLLSEDPVSAAEWYMRHFGLKRRGQGPISREPRYRCGRQTGPSVSMMMDDVNVIIYPIGNAKAAFPEVWKGRTQMESTRGHSIDHLGFAVVDLGAALERLKNAGVTITREPTLLPGTRIRHAFLEGPDHIVIELVEQRQP